jgi:hypothetical protein
MPAQHHGEDGHRLGKAVDRVAPLLLEEQQNGGDQRAGVADTDPPDEVDDGEAPRAGNGDAPDADALEEEPGHRDEHAGGDGRRQEQAAEPRNRRVAVSTMPAIFCVTLLKV